MSGDILTMNRVLTLFHKINKGHTMKKTIILSVLSTLALIGCQSEDTKVTNVSNARADDITQTKRELAQQLSENYTAIEPMLRRDITAQQTNVPVSSFIEQNPTAEFSQQLVEADAQIRSWKGITEFSDQLLEVRLANEKMLGAWLNG
ncbi:DUF3103 family protein, partial [Vibrio parahaemolyticus]|nr:DUF3103 family protein [Vibrio parahaemolyticus]